MRRLLLLIAGFLILLAVAVPTAVIYYTAYTESGLRFLISRIPGKFGDVRLEIAGPSGTIARGIHVERVELDEPLVHLRLEDVGGRVALGPLLWQTIRSPDWYLGKVTIQVKRRTKPPKPSEPVFVPRWLIISAEHTRVGTVVFTYPNGFRLDATDIVLSAVIRHKTIRFFEAQGQFGDTHIAAIGELRAADPLRMDVDGRINWSPDGQPAWIFTTAAKGDLNALDVTAHTVLPFRSDFTGRALGLTNRWHWAGNAIIHDFDLRAWGLKTSLGLITGQLAAQGNQDGFSARGPLNPTGLKLGMFDTEFAGNYSNHVLTATRIDVKHPSSGAHAAGAGTFGIVKHGPRLDLHGTWRDFRWPLVGADIPFRSASGEFTLEGIMPYNVHTNGVATVRDLPSMPTQVDGVLGKDGFTFSRAEVDAFGGHASLNGAVTWAPAHSWNVAGHVTGLDPSGLRPDLPGKLNFTLAAEAHSFDPNDEVAVEFHDLSGRLRGGTASGGGKVSHAGTSWKFDTVRVSVGRTNISLDGRISYSRAQTVCGTPWSCGPSAPVRSTGQLGNHPSSLGNHPSSLANHPGAKDKGVPEEDLDLRFAVAAEDLSLLAPESRGQLEAKGTIRGTPEELTIAATAHGSGIQHKGITLQGFDASVDFDPRSQRDSKIDARLRKFTYGNHTLDSAVFTLAGPAANSTAHLDVKAIGLSAAAQATGTFTHGVFQGQMGSLAINGNESLHLKLERPTGLVVSADRARVEWLCLIGTPASICADGEWSPAQWAATVTANQLPLGTLTAGQTQTVQYQGTINILARIFADGSGPIQGTGRVELEDAVISHRLSNGRIQHTTLGSGTLALTATHGAINADGELESGQIGTLRSRLTAQRGAERWQDMPVHGEVHAQTSELDLISLYLPDIDRAAGNLTADVQVSGTLGTPLLNGLVKLSNAEIDLYQVHLGLRQFGLEAHLMDNGLDFSGSARVGQGTATTAGHFEWRESLPYGKFKLQGTDLRVVDVPEAQIDAAPDLEFNIDGRKIEVTGAVRVPHARIEPKDLSGAGVVRASADEVIVGDEAQDPAKRFEVVSTITLALGDHVNIDTLGLTGRLTGSITVRSGYDSVTRATGELSVEEGKYTAYARKLDIQRGRLIFTGGPIDNPGVDVRAVKQYPDVIAGVNVRGTLLQPRMSFFSEPSLPQAQIVSLILAGGSLESAQNRQSGAGNEALMQGGAILAQQLGARIGLPDISLESDLTNQTSLVLGRYLSPRLYVSYGVSLTQTLNTLKMRYSLGDRWAVRTEVGQARGADLIYSILK